MKRRLSGTVFGFLGLTVLAGAITAGVFVIGYVLDNPAIEGEMSVLVYTAAAALAVMAVFLGLAFLWMADVVNELSAIRAALAAAAAARPERPRAGATADPALSATANRSYADRPAFAPPPAPAPAHANGAAPSAGGRYQSAGGYDDGQRRTMSMDDRISSRLRPADADAWRAPPAGPASDGFSPASPDPLGGVRRGSSAEAVPALNGGDHRDRSPSIARERRRDSDPDALRALRYANGHSERGATSEDPDVAAMQRSGRPLRRRPAPRDPAAELDALLREQERPRDEDDGYRVVRPGAGRTPY